MNDDRLLEALHTANTAIGAIDPTHLDRAVPTCPGWNVGRVITHTSQVHRWVTAILTAAPGERVIFATEEPPSGTTATDWFLEGAKELETELAAVDRERVVFTWAGKQPARWWIRRTAHETSLHGWDAKNGATVAEPVAADLSVDGIDEILDLWIPRRFAFDMFAGSGETIHLHATDSVGEWLVRFGADHVSVERAHAKGDVAVRGAACELLLFLWSRVGTHGFETFGDATILDRYQAAASF